MEKKYSHQDIEKRIYSQWEESNCFSASTDMNNQKETYCIVIPPPNVTGWTAHCMEQRANNRIIRPSADYIGVESSEWVDISDRS